MTLPLPAVTPKSDAKVLLFPLLLTILYVLRPIFNYFYAPFPPYTDFTDKTLFYRKHLQTICIDYLPLGKTKDYTTKSPPMSDIIITFVYP